MKTTLHELLEQRDWLLGDGATGTNLFHQGLEAGYPPELWNVEYPERIEALHQGFVDAGSDIILTNSFGGTAYRLALHHSEGRVAELNQAAAQLARKIADRAARPILVAGSVGPTGELQEPLGALTPETGEAAFLEQIEALKVGGIDVVWIETMSSLDEVEMAVRAAQKTGLPIIATMTFDTAGRSMMGVKPSDYADFARNNKLDGFGANCGVGPAELLDSVRQFRHDTAPECLIAKGNCGIPSYQDGHIHYHGTPELMADYAVLARDSGARIIGGCCGTSFAHVEAMYQALKNTDKSAYPDDSIVEARLGKAWMNVGGADIGKNTDEKNSESNGNTRRRRRRSHS